MHNVHHHELCVCVCVHLCARIGQNSLNRNCRFSEHLLWNRAYLGSVFLFIHSVRTKFIFMSCGMNSLTFVEHINGRFQTSPSIVLHRVTNTMHLVTIYNVRHHCDARARIKEKDSSTAKQLRPHGKFHTKNAKDSAVNYSIIYVHLSRIYY